MRLALSDIVAASGGKLLCGSEDVEITGFTTDSRNVSAGSMFVPIVGEKTDAHRFIPQVFADGAAAVFTQEDGVYPGPAVLVPDCRAALQKAAAFWRGKLSISVIGVTGSVGKTTAKEMIACALSAEFNVLKTEKNHNSQLGVPITVCSIEKEHTTAVVEMGVSMPGEMERIAAVARPTHAVMMNIGTSHLEFLKTRENIMAEKLHIADYLSESGVLFINGDDSLLKHAKPKRGRVVSFGLQEGCEYRVSEIQEDSAGTRFTCFYSGGRLEAYINTFGEHNVIDAAAAVAVAKTLGVSDAGIRFALKKYRPLAGRQSILHSKAGVTILDNSYNASPQSVKAALEVLCKMSCSGRKIAVLADMFELGENAEAGHFECGEVARRLGIDALFAVGKLSKCTAEGFGKNAVKLMNNGEAVDALQGYLKPGDCVLVMGSRGMKTEEIVAFLTEL